MKDTGGPAFPHSRLGSDADGMTLRDYFAAKALNGLLAGLDRDARRFMQREPEPVAVIATASYTMADAMLAERSKE